MDYLKDCLACGAECDVPIAGAEGYFCCPNVMEAWHQELVDQVIARQEKK